jgi:hypothetical protein
MSRRLIIGTIALGAALASASCQDSTSPQASLTLSAASRAVSLSEDSLRVTADSVGVTLDVANPAATTWLATHGGGAWLTLNTTRGTGNGTLRWQRDAAVLPAAGTYVDTITVAVQGSAASVVRLVDTLVIREEPAQYIAVRRAWQPGERDSLRAYILRNNALDEFSEVAAQSLDQEDSTTDVVPNPAWRGAAALPAGVRLAPQFATGWGARGLDILVVFDSLPSTPSIERDSLDWIAVRWWNPADSTWKGWIINATTAGTFATYVNVNTAAFNTSYAHTGVGAGELRLASGTYWEATSGRYRITSNGGYGAYSQLTGGPYLGGDYAVGTMLGRIRTVSMARQAGSDPPNPSIVDFNFGFTPITSWRIRCYFPPVPPVAPYHACTGQAAARLVAAARAGRVTPALLAGMSDPLFNSLAPRPRPRSRRRRRV